MLHLIFDRFADVYLNLKYKVYFTRSRIKGAHTATWIIAGIYGLLLGIIGHLRTPNGYPIFHNKVNNYVSMILDMTILFSGLITFCYLFTKVRRIVEKDNAVIKSNLDYKRKFPTLKFVIPLLMVLTYLIFNVSAAIISKMAFQCRKWGDVEIENRKWHYYSLYFLLTHIGWILVVIGYLSDAFLYIFLLKRIRAYVTDKCFCKKKLEKCRGLPSVTVSKIMRSTNASDNLNVSSGKYLHPFGRPTTGKHFFSN